MRSNRVKLAPPVLTHEGGRGVRISPYAELKRMTLACLLFENAFYSDGETLASRVPELVTQVEPRFVADLARECRDRMHLRHMPLFLVRELARRSSVKGVGTLVADTLAHVIQRPDELTEYLALYWKGQEGTAKESLSAASKRGLARAFLKFSEYDLAKYNGANEYRLKDVMRLVHPNPHDVCPTWQQGRDGDRQAIWRALVNDALDPPDTWEVALSSGADKRETFERLLRDRKLGGLAFLRNLRNMQAAKVDDALIRERFTGPFPHVLPFRFVTALRFAPQYAAELDAAMSRSLAEMQKLAGITGILIDVSGSMDHTISGDSEVTRVDVAAGLAVLCAGVCERSRIFTFSDRVVEVPPYANLSLVKLIHDSQRHSNTLLSEAVKVLNGVQLDRLLVITDEQAQSHLAPRSDAPRAYMINVGTYSTGVGYAQNSWTHIDGWSERILDFVREVEVA